MAHYAFLDKNNIVTEVIVGRNEWEVVDDITDWEKAYGDYRGQKCIRTSYNTQNGIHILGGEPLRKNYAGIGYTYDEARDAFIPIKQFNSWILDEDTCNWKPPIPMPEDEKRYTWNEEDLTWVEVVAP
jgi:hypothetical protein